MLQKTYTYRWYWVPLLLVLFVWPQLLQQQHRYEQSEHIAEQWHCDSDAGQFHLHDTEHYGAHQCTLCHFVYQTTPLAKATASIAVADGHQTEALLMPRLLLLKRSVCSPPGRAPPVVLV